MADKYNRYIKEKNIPIREALSATDMPIWKLAELLNVSENTAYRIMRKNLTAAEQNDIISLIKQAAEQ